MARRYTCSLFAGALLLVMVSGCAKIALTQIVRVKDREVYFRECTLTVWTVIIAMGYGLENCQDKFIQFGKTESVDDSTSRIASVLQ